jgi:hypothetical protein
VRDAYDLAVDALSQLEALEARNSSPNECIRTQWNLSARVGGNSTSNPCLDYFHQGQFKPSGT